MSTHNFIFAHCSALSIIVNFSLTDFALTDLNPGISAISKLQTFKFCRCDVETCSHHNINPRNFKNANEMCKIKTDFLSAFCHAPGHHPKFKKEVVFKIRL
jgi:hypothetical protein